MLYKVLWNRLWKDFSPEIATWEEEKSTHDDYIDEYETGLEAEAEEESDDESDGEESDAGPSSRCRTRGVKLCDGDWVIPTIGLFSSASSADIPRPPVQTGHRARTKPGRKVLEHASLNDTHILSSNEIHNACLRILVAPGYTLCSPPLTSGLA